MPLQNAGYLAALVASILLMLTGRSTASSGRFSWLAVLELLAGGALFLWAALGVDRRSRMVRPGVEPADLRDFLRSLVRTRRGHVTLLFTSSVVTQVVAVKLNTSLPGADPKQWLAFLSWLLSVLLFLIGSRLASSTGDSLETRKLPLKSNLSSLLAISALTLLAFGLRVVARADIPYPLSGDEASVGMGGLAVVSGRVTNMFGTGWSSQPNLSFLLPGLFQALFGADIGGLRLFPAVAGTLAIPLVYLLGVEMWDRRVGLLAAAYLATYHYHIHFSRIAVNNVADATLFAGAFYFLWRAFRTNLASDFAAVGIVSGLGLYSYAGGRYLIVLVLVVTAFQLLHERSALHRRLGGVALLAMGVVLTTLPMALYFTQHLDQFNARMNQVGVFQNGWLEAELRRPGVTLLGIALDRLWRSLFTFVCVPATSGFYNSPEPLLDSAAAVCFIVGLAWAFWHWREARYFTLLVWFFSMVLGTALTVDLPNAARMVATIPAVTLFVVVGLIQLLNVARSLTAIPSRYVYAGSTVAVVALCVLSLHFYFLEYVPRNYFADANSELGMEAGYYLRSLGPGYRTYFFGLPRIFLNFPSIQYLRGDGTGEDGPAKLPPDFLSKLPNDRPAVLIFIPERMREAEQIRQARPDARMLVFQRKTKAEALFVAVELQPSLGVSH